MTEFRAWVEPFAWGFILGFIWNPAWVVIKKITSEAKKAKEEW